MLTTQQQNDSGQLPNLQNVKILAQKNSKMLKK